MLYLTRNWRRMDGWDIVIFLVASPVGGLVAAYGLHLGMRPAIGTGIALALAGFALRRSCSPRLQRMELEAVGEHESVSRVLSLPLIALGIVAGAAGGLLLVLCGLMAADIGLEATWPVFLTAIAIVGLGVASILGGLRLRRRPRLSS